MQTYFLYISSLYMSQSYTSFWLCNVVLKKTQSLPPILCTFVMCLLVPILNTVFEKHSIKATRVLIGVFGSESADEKVEGSKYRTVVLSVSSFIFIAVMSRPGVLFIFGTSRGILLGFLMLTFYCITHITPLSLFSR